MAIPNTPDSDSGSVLMSTDLGPPRATRYEFGAAILYRQVGECAWREGWTVDVSRTGVLFTAQPPAVDPPSPVEMIVVLPDFGSGGISRIRCSGHIVRVAGTEANGQVSVAATIDDYRFLKPTEAASLESEMARGQQ
jgi:hypothetical protein